MNKNILDRKMLEKAKEIIKKIKGDLHYNTTALNIDDVFIDEMEDDLRKALSELEKTEEKIEKLEDSLQKILNWIHAYPLEVFPEPDMKKAAKVLEEAGISLDSISASNMRHVLKGIKDIIEKSQNVEQDAK